MPRLWKKIGKFADKIFDKIADEVKEHSSEFDFSGTFSTLSVKGKEVAALSRETIQICDRAANKREQMTAFSSEIQATLSGFGKGHDSSILETIKELTAGDKVAAATELASGLDEAALACVEKSTQMMDLMEEGMESLPTPVKNALEGYAADKEAEEETTGILKGIDQDLQDVQLCIDSIHKLNLSTALKVGVQAFEQLADKAQRSQLLFDAIRSFADDVREISEAFESMSPTGVASKSKDMLRCISLSDELRQVADVTGKLIRMLIELFKATAERVSGLWSALAFAKDCMSDCLIHVNETKQLCFDAKERSLALVSKSLSVKDQLQQVGRINLQSVNAVRGLVEGGDMKEAIDIAASMDDLIAKCSGKVVAMVDRVSEGFKHLPDVLTEGMDVAAAGSGLEEDPEPANVEADIAELEESQAAIENADLISASRAGVRGFTSVSDKATVCQEMLCLVEQFAGSCDTTIDSFLSVWDLKSAGKKITEMCQLVNLGEMMKQFADQIKRLLVAIVALMKASIAKFKGLDLGDIKDTFGAATDDLKDTVDELKDEVKDKLKFWKK